MRKKHQENLDIEIATLPIVSRAETLIALTREKRFDRSSVKEKLEIEMVTTVYRLSGISNEIASNERLKAEGISTPASLLAARLIFLLGYNSTEEFINEYQNKREILLKSPEFDRFLVKTQEHLNKLR